jgi:hypothetical protein
MPVGAWEIAESLDDFVRVIEVRIVWLGAGTAMKTVPATAGFN